MSLKMKSLVLLIASCTCLVNCHPPHHPDVVAVRHEEERLHPLLRSPALRNPHLLKILPLSSLLHEGEKLVFERESNKVPRTEIYKVLTHAGLIPRRRYASSFENSGHIHNEITATFPEKHIGFHDSLYFPSQDVLQHL